MAGLGFLSQAAETKKRDATLLILINAFNFKRVHANSYNYTKSFCSTTVRELLEIAPFIPPERELKTDVRPELDQFYPDFLSSPYMLLFLFITATFILHVVDFDPAGICNDLGDGSSVQALSLKSQSSLLIIPSPGHVC